MRPFHGRGFIRFISGGVAEILLSAKSTTARCATVPLLIVFDHARVQVRARAGMSGGGRGRVRVGEELRMMRTAVGRARGLRLIRRSKHSLSRGAHLVRMALRRRRFALRAMPGGGGRGVVWAAGAGLLAYRVGGLGGGEWQSQRRHREGDLGHLIRPRVRRRLPNKEGDLPVEASRSDWPALPPSQMGCLIRKTCELSSGASRQENSQPGMVDAACKIRKVAPSRFGGGRHYRACHTTRQHGTSDQRRRCGSRLSSRH